MSSEVFRFVTIRPPQQIDDLDAFTKGDDGSGSSAAVLDLGQPSNAFFDELRGARTKENRDAMLGIVKKFETTASFADSPRKLDGNIVAFTAATQRLGAGDDYWSNVQAAFSRTLPGTAAAFITSDAYTSTFQTVATSIVAAAIDPDVSPKVRSVLIRVARALWLLKRLAGNMPATQSESLSVPLALPAGIFPIPSDKASLKDGEIAQAKVDAASVVARRKKLAQLTSDLSAHQQAIQELLGAFQLTGAQSMPAAPRKKSGAIAMIKPPAGFLLSDAGVKSLSATTTSTLKKLGASTSQIDIAKSITLLEKGAATLASQLYTSNGRSGRMIQLGNLILPANALTTTIGTNFLPTPDDSRSPGLCAPVPETAPTDDTVTVPSGVGDARILGIADLMVVEQNLLRYQLGEIAHIENVLKSEVRSRTFKTTDETVQTTTLETETTEDKETDLSSTERFELQTQSQTVIADTASRDAGLTIHASYGPSVDATANYNSATTNSTTQSNTASASYAREITNKAVDRVQTRTLTARTVTTTNIIREINRHSFDNKDGTGDIVGVYRYVDKVYLAQVVNYGKRLMLEFIVPEPAAFLRYAYTNKPVDNVSQINPEPPGYCLADGVSFVSLQATDITRDNYLLGEQVRRAGCGGTAAELRDRIRLEKLPRLAGDHSG